MSTTAHRPVTRLDRAVNAVVRRLADSGVSLAGAQTLTVRGRRTGAPHRIPVNPLEHDGRRYLVAPRGTTDWVRNARAQPAASLRTGRREEAVTLVETDDADIKTAVLTRYLSVWGWEVGRLLPPGLTPDADEAVLRDYLDRLPVFEVRPSIR
ncbi:nitroreductase/quinone reductase family protein [Gordonia caeni]|uniref:Nitroreductase/quinone reductase family protein n=1 Tax=Gordonia caeni TaxID=1007097 RepID=A0ABP7PDV5_9ACTN